MYSRLLSLPLLFRLIWQALHLSQDTGAQKGDKYLLLTALLSLFSSVHQSVTELQHFEGKTQCIYKRS